MVVLSAILVLIMASGLFVFSQTETAKKTISNDLSLQMQVFKNEISTYFEEVAALSIDLSIDMTDLIDGYIKSNNMDFEDINNSVDDIKALQDNIMKETIYKLQQSNCSGIFVTLNATVNTEAENAQASRTGVYIQKSGADLGNKDLILYRGMSDIGKNNDLMIHRKWRLEINTQNILGYSNLEKDAKLPLTEAYKLTDVVSLTGTDEKAALMVVPMISNDGIFFGLCGFEISQSYFKTKHAQPSNMEHLVSIIAKGSQNEIIANNGLSCGLSNGYYLAPKGIYTYKSIGGDLVELSNQTDSHIGMISEIKLSHSDNFDTVVVMMPKTDFESKNFDSWLQIIILIILFTFFIVSFCLLFAKRFFSPILRIMENLQSENEAIQSNYKSVKAQLDRLAKNQKPEIDQEKYRYFMSQIEKLTPTEKRIFDYYCEGYSVKDIIKETSTKEATIRFHNQNIYLKLGVDSLKQLLFYISFMKLEEHN